MMRRGHQCGQQLPHHLHRRGPAMAGASGVGPCTPLMLALGGAIGAAAAAGGAAAVAGAALSPLTSSSSVSSSSCVSFHHDHLVDRCGYVQCRALHSGVRKGPARPPAPRISSRDSAAPARASLVREVDRLIQHNVAAVYSSLGMTQQQQQQRAQKRQGDDKEDEEDDDDDDPMHPLASAASTRLSNAPAGAGSAAPLSSSASVQMPNSSRLPPAAPAAAAAALSSTIPLSPSSSSLLSGIGNINPIFRDEHNSEEPVVNSATAGTGKGGSSDSVDSSSKRTNNNKKNSTSSSKNSSRKSISTARADADAVVVEGAAVRREAAMARGMGLLRVAYDEPAAVALFHPSASSDSSAAASSRCANRNGHATNGSSDHSTTTQTTTTTTTSRCARSSSSALPLFLLANPMPGQSSSGHTAAATATSGGHHDDPSVVAVSFSLVQRGGGGGRNGDGGVEEVAECELLLEAEQGGVLLRVPLPLALLVDHDLTTFDANAQRLAVVSPTLLEALLVRGGGAVVEGPAPLAIDHVRVVPTPTAAMEVFETCFRQRRSSVQSGGASGTNKIAAASASGVGSASASASAAVDKQRWFVVEEAAKLLLSAASSHATDASGSKAAASRQSSSLPELLEGCTFSTDSSGSADDGPPVSAAASSSSSVPSSALFPFARIPAADAEAAYYAFVTTGAGTQDTSAGAGAATNTVPNAHLIGRAVEQLVRGKQAVLSHHDYCPVADHALAIVWRVNDANNISSINSTTATTTTTRSASSASSAQPTSSPYAIQVPLPGKAVNVAVASPPSSSSSTPSSSSSLRVSLVPLQALYAVATDALRHAAAAVHASRTRTNHHHHQQDDEGRLVVLQQQVAASPFRDSGCAAFYDGLTVADPRLANVLLDTATAAAPVKTTPPPSPAWHHKRFFPLRTATGHTAPLKPSTQTVAASRLASHQPQSEEGRGSFLCPLSLRRSVASTAPLTGWDHPQHLDKIPWDRALIQPVAEGSGGATGSHAMDPTTMNRLRALPPPEVAVVRFDYPPSYYHDPSSEVDTNATAKKKKRGRKGGKTVAEEALSTLEAAASDCLPSTHAARREDRGHFEAVQRARLLVTIENFGFGVAELMDGMGGFPLEGRSHKQQPSTSPSSQLSAGDAAAAVETAGTTQNTPSEALSQRRKKGRPQKHSGASSRYVPFVYEAPQPQAPVTGSRPSRASAASSAVSAGSNTLMVDQRAATAEQLIKDIFHFPRNCHYGLFSTWSNGDGWKREDLGDDAAMAADIIQFNARKGLITAAEAQQQLAALHSQQQSQGAAHLSSSSKKKGGSSTTGGHHHHHHLKVINKAGSNPHEDGAYSGSHLDLHTDNTYYMDAPKLQGFGCVLHHSGRTLGGESTLVDGIRVALELARLCHEDDAGSTISSLSSSSSSSSLLSSAVSQRYSVAERRRFLELLCTVPVRGGYNKEGYDYAAYRPVITLSPGTTPGTLIELAAELRHHNNATTTTNDSDRNGAEDSGKVSAASPPLSSGNASSYVQWCRRLQRAHGGPGVRPIVERISFNNSDRSPLNPTVAPDLFFHHHRDSNSNNSNNTSGGLFDTAITTSSERIRDFYRAYEWFHAAAHDPALAVHFSLKPGHMLFFDNHRVLHGRMAFAGPRVMCGSYVSTDEYYSALRSACALLSRCNGGGM